jgi:hypothetical protein
MLITRVNDGRFIAASPDGLTSGRPLEPTKRLARNPGLWLV